MKTHSGNFALLQVLYRQNWPGRTTSLETNKTSVELQIPSGEDYLIEIKALTDGGEGTSSGPIRIPKMSSELEMSREAVGRVHSVKLIPCD